jgi:hypothetical protein
MLEKCDCGKKNLGKTKLVSHDISSGETPRENSYQITIANNSILIIKENNQRGEKEKKLYKQRWNINN